MIQTGPGYGYGDGMGGGIAWIIVLIALLGGRGFGGNDGFWGGGGNATMAANMGTVSNDFMFTNLHTDIVDGFSELRECCCDTEKDILMTANATQMAIAQQGYQTQLGLCGVERNIDSVNYNNAKNTCEIIHAQDKNTQAILNKMDCIEMQNLRDKLCECRDELSNTKQSAYLIDQIRPCAQPAYITCSPYASNPAYGFGGGYGFGRGFDGRGFDGCCC